MSIAPKQRDRIADQFDEMQRSIEEIDGSFKRTAIALNVLDALRHDVLNTEEQENPA